MTVPAPSQLDLRQEVHDAARRARVAARRLASLPTTVKDRALHAAADELLAHRDQILAANAEDLNAAREADTEQIDAAAVMVNASTAFTDGEQFGFGAEIGISTQKLHARGPMGLPELTSTKWIAWGAGHTRPA